MVRKAVTLILMLALECQCAQATPAQPLPPLKLWWPETGHPSCRKLVESFLAELRTLATDRAIELEVTPTDDSRHLKIQCRADDASAIDVSDETTTFTMHHLAKAGGFDANDWLPFQRRFLRATPPEEISLAPRPAERGPAAPLPLEAASTATVPAETRPALYQRWWFWAIAGGVGAGVWALTHSIGGHDSNRINVEIH